ncbi:MAG TPA: alpha/beta hydrolase [Tepidisphaeraceae bacterium]|jgi:esterase/lipase superfamily enzyme
MKYLLTTILLAACLLVMGCESGTQLMPTPNLYTQSGVDPFPDVPPALQNNRVEVLYLTDRKPEKPEPGNPHYGFERSRSVAFGVSEVEFGKDVSWEQIAAASRTSKRAVDLPIQIVKTTELIRFPETPKILLSKTPVGIPAPAPTTAAIQIQEALGEDVRHANEELSARLAKTPDKDVYLFVHGYNNTFEDSVSTIAQLWHFLGRHGVPIAYSWPAGHGGLLRGYTYDRESSEFTVYHLKQMIRAIAECPDVKKLHIICHSRGTGVVVSALAELYLEISGSGRSTREVLKLGSLVLAAPDIDLDVLIQRAVTIRLGQIPEHTTVYICAKDQALGISNWLFGGTTRFGRVRADMFGPDELALLRESKTVQIVDCHIADPGPYGHSYFHSNPAVSSDLILLMRYGLLPGPQRPLQTEPSGFWILDDKYPGPITPPSQPP